MRVVAIVVARNSNFVSVCTGPYFQQSIIADACWTPPQDLLGIGRCLLSPRDKKSTVSGVRNTFRGLQALDEKHPSDHPIQLRGSSWLATVVTLRYPSYRRARCVRLDRALCRKLQLVCFNHAPDICSLKPIIPSCRTPLIVTGIAPAGGIGCSFDGQPQRRCELSEEMPPGKCADGGETLAGLCLLEGILGSSTDDRSIDLDYSVCLYPVHE